jgi:hypothetical protein
MNLPGDSKNIRDLGTYEMLWDCKFCGAKALPAKTHKFCPTCGAAQDPNTRRFPSDEDKRAVAGHVVKGANLICKACSTPNAADAQYCQQCGAPLEGAARAATVKDEVRGMDERFAEGQERDLAGEQLKADLGASAPTAKASGPPWVLIGLGVAAVVCIGAVLLALFWTRPASFTVSDHSWQREILIEALAPRQSSAWCDALPNDAYNVSVRSEQRDTRRIPAGEDCSVRRIDNGDGTFSERQECVPRYREEPVYDDRCYFTVNRWGYERSVTSSGTGQAQAPYWAQMSLARGTGSGGLGSEREAGRRERYVISFVSADDKTFECEVDYAFWQNVREETAWTMDVSVVSGAPNCDTLQPAS